MEQGYWSRESRRDNADEPDPLEHVGKLQKTDKAPKPPKPAEPPAEPADPADGLSPGLALAWGVRPRPRPGRKPGLDLDRIVAAAIALADAEGLAAVSMSRLAGELGFTTMSLYRYVTGKDELLSLMFDAGMGPPPVLDPTGWRAGLAGWSRGILDAYRRHPWATSIPIGGPPITPHQVAWMEAGLATMGGTGLLSNERPSVILLLSGFVRNAAQLERDLASAGTFGEGDEDAMRGWSGTVLRLAGDRMPALAAVIEAGVFDRADHPDTEFEFGLARILDGVEMLVQARARR